MCLSREKWRMGIKIKVFVGDEFTEQWGAVDASTSE
jgi:hypothetical protein